MDAAVRAAVREVGLPIEVASVAASGEPARVLGLADRCGAIAVGLDADLVLLDDELSVRRIMAQGEWVPPSREAMRRETGASATPRGRRSSGV
jgi:N-acetylglucosamine-6-phosphate deacetylase